MVVEAAEVASADRVNIACTVVATGLIVVDIVCVEVVAATLVDRLAVEDRTWTFLSFF